MFCFIKQTKWDNFFLQDLFCRPKLIYNLFLLEEIVIFLSIILIITFYSIGASCTQDNSFSNHPEIHSAPRETKNFYLTKNNCDSPLIEVLFY